MATLNTDLVALCADLDSNTLKEIIDTSLSDARLNNFLNMAWYTSIPLSGKLNNCGGDGALCEIILLLAAHFLTTYERQVKSEGIAGEWSVSFLGRDGLGLDASLYGQQAKVLDCSGTLASAGLKSVLIHVVDYEQLLDLDDENQRWNV